MNLTLFKTKKVGRCESCHEQTQGGEKLELVKIIKKEFWLCSDCIIGQQNSTPEQNQEFEEKYGKKIRRK